MTVCVGKDESTQLTFSPGIYLVIAQKHHKPDVPCAFQHIPAGTMDFSPFSILFFQKFHKPPEMMDEMVSKMAAGVDHLEAQLHWLRLVEPMDGCESSVEAAGAEMMLQKQIPKISKDLLKKNLANKIFGCLARCEFWQKLRW